jgi:crossover junction endodeoxyribonuclease RuvC
MPIHQGNRVVRTIGIDPGIGGAIAWIDPERGVCIHDMPVIGKHNVIDAVELARILRQARDRLRYPHVVCELAQPMPTQDIAAAFDYGRAFGTIESTVVTLNLLCTFIAPAVWKHRAGIGLNDKRDVIARAIELRPDAAPLLRGTQDYGRAAALLIAIVCGHDLTTQLA